MPILELAQRQNLLHRRSEPQTILRHTVEDVRTGRLAMVSSFGAYSVVLLHMLSCLDTSVPVLFIDTQMLFPETLKYQKEVAEFLGLKDVRVISPDRPVLMNRDIDSRLHQSNPDACCRLRKTDPLAKALQGFDTWISGRRRSQGGERAGLNIFEREEGRLKVNPLATWNKDHIRHYISQHRLPRHPLLEKGYPSIGCQPCTTRVRDGEDERAGRWRGTEKTECGIHNGPKAYPNGNIKRLA